MSDLPELTEEERAAFAVVDSDWEAFFRWRKANRPHRGDDDRLPIVYNGKSVEEWYELYVKQAARVAELEAAAGSMLDGGKRRMTGEWIMDANDVIHLMEVLHTSEGSDET